MSDITIRLAEAETDLEKAENFVRETAFKWHKCSPPPPTQLLFMAEQNAEVVGTIGLDFSKNSAPFRLERNYEILREESPWPFVSEKLAQYSRWMAKIPNISARLIRFSAAYAMEKGKLYGFGETKPFLMPRLAALGVDARIIPHRKFKIENIPIEARAYYLEESAPVLFMINLAQITTTIGP